MIDFCGLRQRDEMKATSIQMNAGEFDAFSRTLSSHGNLSPTKQSLSSGWNLSSAHVTIYAVTSKLKSDRSSMRTWQLNRKNSTLFRYMELRKYIDASEANLLQKMSSATVISSVQRWNDYTTRQRTCWHFPSPLNDHSVCLVSPRIYITLLHVPIANYATVELSVACLIPHDC